ncbi:MAG: hypothetical protein P9M11_07860 [Candidatus Tenebribacter burtonii]|jgi:hypothetical protein|nr:hypothetical protein [Candidatus Tenebribacter burtonii]
MKLISKILVVIGTILMLFGFITFLQGSAFLGVGYPVNYFHAAISFLLLALCLELVWKSKKKE